LDIWQTRKARTTIWTRPQTSCFPPPDWPISRLGKIIIIASLIAGDQDTENCDGA
jgi:hypothetical protein